MYIKLLKKKNKRKLKDNTQNVVLKTKEVENMNRKTEYIGSRLWTSNLHLREDSEEKNKKMDMEEYVKDVEEKFLEPVTTCS